MDATGTGQGAVVNQDGTVNSADTVSLWGTSLIETTSFACMTELLLKAHQIGAAITEQPLSLRYDLKQGPSKIPVWSTVCETIEVLLKHWINSSTGRFRRCSQPYVMPGGAFLTRSAVLLPEPLVVEDHLTSLGITTINKEIV